MSKPEAKGKGTKDDPWILKTPSLKSEFMIYKDETLDPPALICIVGKTTLSYQLRAIDDLHAMLKKHNDWMELASADEQKPAKPGSIRANTPSLRFNAPLMTLLVLFLNRGVTS